MLIHLHGTGPHNAGAAMMEEAVRAHFSSVNPMSVVRNIDCMPGRRARAMAFLRGLLPSRAPDVLLDASGLAYSDDCDWSTPFFDRMDYLLREVPSKTHVVFLPQTFGPFRTPASRERMTRIARRANLLFARERSSFQALLPLVDDPAKLILAADFSIVPLGPSPAMTESSSENVLIVPNAHVSKEDVAKVRRYAESVADCVATVVDHGTGDRAGAKIQLAIQSAFKDGALIAPFLQALHERGLPQVSVHQATEPAALRYLIQLNTIVIGSRYHSLVTALHSGHLVFGFGWNDKYDEAFASYEVSSNLLSLEMRSDEVRSRVIEAMRAHGTAVAREVRNKARARHEADVSRMWSIVDKLTAGSRFDIRGVGQLAENPHS